jgi:PTS system nitrogen regulatory IIA component
MSPPATPARFHHFLAEGNVVCGLQATTSDEAIRELVGLLVRHQPGLSFAEIVDAVTTRENLMPTVVAPGLAVPHARLPGIRQILVALGTSPAGIDFRSPGMPPVNVVILILSPKDSPAIHLQILATLAKDFKDPQSVARVAAIQSPGALLEFFASSTNAIGDHLQARDVMNPRPVVLFEHETLEKAIETFAIHGVLDIPVVDQDNDIRGALSLEDILRFSLPEHLLWMNDLSPILDFQPFAEMLKSERETKIADIMREEVVTVAEALPAIQLAKMFIMENLRQIIVSRDGKFAGVVNLHSFTTKLFWA